MSRCTKRQPQKNRHSLQRSAQGLRFSAHHLIFTIPAAVNTKTRPASPAITAAPPGEAEELPYSCGTQGTKQIPFTQDFSLGQQELLFHTELNPIKQNQLNTESTLDLQGKREAATYSPAQLLTASKASPALSLSYPAGGEWLLYKSPSWKVPGGCSWH